MAEDYTSPLPPLQLPDADIDVYLRPSDASEDNTPVAAAAADVAAAQRRSDVNSGQAELRSSVDAALDALLDAAGSQDDSNNVFLTAEAAAEMLAAHEDAADADARFRIGSTPTSAIPGTGLTPASAGSGVGMHADELASPGAWFGQRSVPLSQPVFTSPLRAPSTTSSPDPGATATYTDAPTTPSVADTPAAADAAPSTPPRAGSQPQTELEYTPGRTELTSPALRRLQQKHGFATDAATGAVTGASTGAATGAGVAAAAPELPELLVTPRLITVSVAAAATGTVTIGSTASAGTLIDVALAVTGRDAARFTTRVATPDHVATTDRLTLQPGEPVRVHVVLVDHAGADAAVAMLAISAALRDGRALAPVVVPIRMEGASVANQHQHQHQKQSVSAAVLEMPGHVDWGSVVAGSDASTTRSLVIRNPSPHHVALVLALDSAAPSSLGTSVSSTVPPPAFRLGATRVYLAPGASQAVAVTLTAASPGTAVGAVRVALDSADTDGSIVERRVSLRADLVAARWSVTPVDALDFGTLAYNQTAEQPVRVSNDSDGALTLRLTTHTTDATRDQSWLLARVAPSAEAEAAAAADVLLTPARVSAQATVPRDDRGLVPQLEVNLAPHADAVVWVQFAPVGYRIEERTVDYHGQLRIAAVSANQDSPRASLVLAARVGYTRLQVPREAHVWAFRAPVRQRVSRVVPLRNAGCIAVTVNASIDSPAFTCEPSRLTILPDSVAELRVAFLPDVAADYHAHLTLQIPSASYRLDVTGVCTAGVDDDAERAAVRRVTIAESAPMPSQQSQRQQQARIGKPAPVTVPTSARSVATSTARSTAAIGDSALVCDRPVVAWPTLDVGDVATQHVRLRNNSSGSVRVAVSAAGADVFSVREQSVEMPGFAEHTVQVRFAPVAVAEYSGTLCMVTEPGGERFKVPLRGVGGRGRARIDLPLHAAAADASLDTRVLARANASVCVANDGVRAIWACWCVAEADATGVRVVPPGAVIAAHSSHTFAVAVSGTVRQLHLLTGDEVLRQRARRAPTPGTLARRRTLQQVREAAMPVSVVCGAAARVSDTSDAVTVQGVAVARETLLDAFVGEEAASPALTSPSDATERHFDGVLFDASLRRVAVAVPGGAAETAQQCQPQQQETRWLVSPEHVSVSRAAPARVLVMNPGPDDVAFDVVWSPHRLHVAPAHGIVSAGSDAALVVALAADPAVRDAELAGREYYIIVQSGAAQRRIAVRIAGASGAPDSHKDATDARAGTGSSSCVVRVHEVDVSPAAMVLPVTAPAAYVTARLRFANQAHVPRTWRLTPVAEPVVLRSEAGVRRAPVPAPYAFSLQRTVGTLPPRECDDVRVTFAPSVPGTFTQDWRVSVDGCEQDATLRLTGRSARAQTASTAAATAAGVGSSVVAAGSAAAPVPAAVRARTAAPSKNRRGARILQPTQASAAKAKASVAARKRRRQGPDARLRLGVLPRPGAASDGTDDGKAGSADAAVATSTTAASRHPRCLFVPTPSLVFPNTPVREQRTLKLRVCNGSRRDMVVRVESSRPNVFLVRHTRIDIRAHSYVKLPVRFRPRVRGDVSASLCLTSDAANHSTSVDVALRGAGVDSPLVISAAALYFTPPASDDAAVLRNTSTRPVAWAAAGDDACFSVTPSRGVLAPGAEQRLCVQYEDPDPLHKANFDSSLLISVGEHVYATPLHVVSVDA